MKKIFYLLFCIILFATSCTKKEKKEIIIENFPAEEQLTANFIHLENSPLCPSYIGIIDSILLVGEIDEFCSPTCFYVYNSNTLKFLGTFGKKGKGPNEFVMLENPVQSYQDENFIGVWVQDIGNYKNRLINITESLKNKQTVVEKSYIVPKEIVCGIGIITLPNNDILGTSFSEKGRLFYLDDATKKIKWVNFFPKINKQIKDNLHNLYGGPIGISPDGKKIVSALMLFKRIDIFNLKLENILSYKFKDSPKEPKCFMDQNNLFPDDCVEYYFDLVLTEKYIYALNANISYADYDNEYPPSEIHVFNYNGKAIKIIKLDRFIGNFTIDEQNGYLYGLTLPTEEHPNDIIRYNFKL